MGHGPGSERSLLHPSRARWRNDVSGLQNDADDHHRSTASPNDENYAAYFFRDVRSFSVFQRLGVVYFNQQPGGYRPAVVSEPDPSASRPGQANARQEVRPAR